MLGPLSVHPVLTPSQSLSGWRSQERTQGPGQAHRDPEGGKGQGELRSVFKCWSTQERRNKCRSRSCQMCCAAHLTQRGLCLSSVTPTDTFAQAEVEHIHTTNWSTLHPLWSPVCIIVLENVVSNLFPSYLLVKQNTASILGPIPGKCAEIGLG